LLRRLLRSQGIHPETITTDKLTSYGAAVRELGLKGIHRPGGLQTNGRAENRHLPTRRRGRKQQKFKSQGSAQRFLATHAVVCNTFNLQEHLTRRSPFPTFRAAAHDAWAEAPATA
jgi:transposase-like protein